MNYLDIITQQADAITVIEAGILNVPSGKIVACDPLANPERDAFTRTIPIGKYPVHLYLHKDESAIGLAWLEVTKEEPVTWEMAVLQDQKIEDLKEDYYYGYPVDAGIGCFMDALSADFLCAVNDSLYESRGNDFNYYDDIIAHEMAKNEDLYTNHFPSDDSKLNVIMFSSGWGDGVFASYWGLDATGKVACLVTDFNMFSDK